MNNLLSLWFYFWRNICQLLVLPSDLLYVWYLNPNCVITHANTVSACLYFPMYWFLWLVESTDASQRHGGLLWKTWPQLILLFEGISWSQSPADAEGWLYSVVLVQPQAYLWGISEWTRYTSEQLPGSATGSFETASRFSYYVQWQKHWVWMKLVYWLEYSSIYDLSAPLKFTGLSWSFLQTVAIAIFHRFLNLVNIDPILSLLQ